MNKTIKQQKTKILSCHSFGGLSPPTQPKPHQVCDFGAIRGKIGNMFVDFSFFAEEVVYRDCQNQYNFEPTLRFMIQKQKLKTKPLGNTVCFGSQTNRPAVAPKMYT